MQIEENARAGGFLLLNGRKKAAQRSKTIYTQASRRHQKATVATVFETSLRFLSIFYAPVTTLADCSTDMAKGYWDELLLRRVC